jgi:hypothetical protein
VAGASLAAVTLMACYGMPPCDDGTYQCYDDVPEQDAGETLETDGGETDAGEG